MQIDIEKQITRFIRSYELQKNIKTKWKNPLVAFASATDPLFIQLKDLIDKEHKLPTELMPKAISVITYFIPFNDDIVLSNDVNERPSIGWAIAYIETNKLITDLNKFLAQELKNNSFDSVLLPPTHNFDQKKLVSYWSHKHVAYIAGLGKFGLHKMLITEKGCCGRLGSLITNAYFKPTEKADGEYCLYYQSNTCMKCLEKCLFGALEIDFFNRKRCYKICLENIRRFSNLGVADVCGKCACGIPCSIENPVQS